MENINQHTNVTVLFEFTDAHMSIIDDGSYIQDIINRCVKLCEVFDFEFKIDYRSLDTSPHLAFRVTFLKNVVSFQHYMNVLGAFAQEFQINMANGFESHT